ncbi:membrane carboxypeptidase [Cyanobium sp. Copco_Reservoir_LC18]|uniref:transglycosylase domain-containing protein n=1 Tax=Cyanobium sp. Copco_Reservoir_LC18 TaxID=1328305 RepID=UPI0013593C61|nr:transglycosylase domain-containing protein [Cyanobium sp. Copco_Reservoir_LC18]KAF0654398.1 membrane carboxypeptidase [Cyanobium sp. Copco_Reservoir_LC18]
MGGTTEQASAGASTPASTAASTAASAAPGTAPATSGDTGSSGPRSGPGGWASLWRALRAPSAGGRRRDLAGALGGLRHHDAWLELWIGGQCRRRLALEGGRYRIGRDPLCELQAEATGVSRVHVIVEQERPGDRDYVGEDFGSANGLFHRDRRIRTIRLRDGDRLQLGSPLKGEAPTLVYRHPRSPLGQLVHWGAIGALVGSGVALGGLLLATTVAGGSAIRSVSGPVKVFSTDGRQIDAAEGSSTALPTLADYPLHLRQALIASEDSRFGWNSGIDLFGTLRSLVQGTGGGSGLTQQVARMVYPAVGTDVSVARKLRELWVAWQLEAGFSKNRILKMYLDRAYLGLGAEGFEQAAQLYFRKSASDLDVAESAFLVGLLPSPNSYSPCNRENPTWGRERRDLVLGRMHAEGYLSDQALIDARRRPLNIDPSACRESTYSSYPFFSDYVIGELEGRRFALDLSSPEARGNYAVISSIDPRLQAIAQKQLKAFLEGPGARAGLTQGALISIDYATGAILAYVGGGDYSRSSFDRVQALRQPGSTFKLFAFLAALEAGAKPGDAVSCAPLSYVAGCRGGGGSTSVAAGFASSENVVALRLAQQAGLNKVVAKARQLGISTPMEESFSMVLGGKETFLYELAEAYAVVANGGRSVPLHGVTRIYDLGICGSVRSLATCPPTGVTTPIGEKPQQLIDPAVAAEMDALLRGVVSNGTGRAAGVVADARGKTGTTDNGVDVLFVGYSPSSRILTGIWMGNDDNRPAEAASGALVAQLWGQYMRALAG